MYVTNLAFLAKKLLVDSGGVHSVRQYGGVDQSDSAAIPYKVGIQDLVSQFTSAGVSGADMVSWEC